MKTIQISVRNSLFTFRLTAIPLQAHCKHPALQLCRYLIQNHILLRTDKRYGDTGGKSRHTPKPGTLSQSHHKIPEYVFVYTPLVQKDEYLDHENSSFLKRFYNGSLSSMLANFIEKDRLSEQEIENLQELLAQRSLHEK